jgi:uncharacterized membrane protein
MKSKTLSDEGARRMRRVVLAAVTGVIVTQSAVAQTIHMIALHNPPGCIARPRAIAGNGSRVFGDNCPTGWKWTVSGGLQQLPEYGGTTPLSANYAGDVAVGYAGFPGFAGIQSAYWLESFGAPLNPGIIPGYTYSIATDITDDSSIIVGYAQNEPGTNPPFVAVRWAAGGFTQLPPAPGQTVSRRATCISGDGQWIFGYSSLNNGFGSMPTRWGPNGVVLAMGLPIGEPTESFPLKASTDGTVAVGYGLNVHTWRWRDGFGYQNIASPPGTTARPSDMTAGGDTIVGSVYLNQDNSYAAFWTQSGQWMDLNTYLPTQGLDLNGWFLNTCFAVSDDGRTLAGTGFYNGQAAAWAITGIRSICGPRIQTQTIAASKCAGQNAQLSVFAIPPSSPGANSYQWWRYYPGTPFSFNVMVNNGPTGYGSTVTGATNPNLFINNARLQDGGLYYCMISGGCTTTPSAYASLNILPDISGNGGSIDTADLTIMLGNFGSTVTPWTNGDLNGDGFVNTIDLTAFLGVFGTSCP